ncbi:hypothetical protein BKH46_07630 [Helicobacter sp. 12S02634-8]|nr:hypothetical protein BKH46_07630 [Helicobacter sp. 12S02634-8]
MQIQTLRQTTDTITQARVLYYDFFSGLFLFELLKNRQELLKKQIQILKEFALNPQDTQDFSTLQNELETSGLHSFITEFSALFTLPFGKGDQAPVYLYLSHYLEDCIGGESLVRAKSIIKKGQCYLNTKRIKESEENLGFLFVAMRHFLENGELALAKELFATCIYPMQDGVCKAIASRVDCPLYACVNRILEGFLRLEESILVP